MKHLIQILNNKRDYEINRRFEINQKYFAYKINGYWFYLSRRMWSKFREINYNTICSRDNGTKTVGQILGFEPMNTTNKGQFKVGGGRR